MYQYYLHAFKALLPSEIYYTCCEPQTNAYLVKMLLRMKGKKYYSEKVIPGFLNGLKAADSRY